jgi:predicted flap endonuclease-1-like 5' DNA nuclease
MAGSPVKRIIGTFLFTVALIVFAGFMFLLFADAENLNEVPGTDKVDDIGLVAAIILGVIALLLLLLLIVKRIDTRARRAAEAEAYYIPEADREQMLARKRGAFDSAFHAGTGPAPTPPDVLVYYLPGVPLADKGALWGAPERHGNETTWPMYFPRSVDSGVYVNDYIQVDRKGNRLKLRTLLAGLEDYPTEAPPAPPAPAPEPKAEAKAEPKPAEPLAEKAPADARPPRPEPRGDNRVGKIGGRTELASDRFMRELESRNAAGPATEATVEEANDVFYDYPGEVRFIEEVEGIGPVYGTRLREAGVHTTARLCFEDPVELSYRVDVATKTVRQWQAMAELMKVNGIGPQYAEALARAGVEGIADLKKRSAATLAEQVNEYLESLEVNLLGQKVSERRIQAFQDASRDLRRVRMKIPVE